MAAAVARGHGGDGAGDLRPSPRDLGSGHRGSSQPRRGRGRGGGRGGATGGVRKEVRSVNKNVKLKKAVDDFGPQLLELDFKDLKTLYPVGKTAAWFANFVGELVREIPLCYESWHKIELEKRAHMFPRIEEMFDLGPLRRSEQWGTIQAAFNEYFADRYRDNKSAFKATHFLNRGGYDAVDEIRRNPPPNMELSMWEKYIEHYMDEKHVKRAAINKENRKKNKVHSRHGSRSLAASRHQYFETSETHEYPSLIQSYYDQRCKNGEWMQDEARVNYEEMCRLRDLGADNPLGRPYTEVEILVIVLKGKQRGKVAGVGRVLSEKMILPPVSPRSSSYDKEKIDEMMAAKDKKIADLQKKTEEQAKESKAVQRQVSEFFKVVQTHPPDRWSELMSQIASRSDVGSGSGAGGSGGGGSVDLDEEGSDHDDDDE